MGSLIAVGHWSIRKTLVVFLDPDRSRTSYDMTRRVETIHSAWSLFIIHSGGRVPFHPRFRETHEYISRKDLVRVVLTHRRLHYPLFTPLCFTDYNKQLIVHIMSARPLTRSILMIVSIRTRTRFDTDVVGRLAYTRF